MIAIEAIADAIQVFEGWHPQTKSYRNRNPGNLEGGSKVDAKNYDVFGTLVDGYQALLNELKAKFSGHNHHGVGPNSTLLDLFNIYAPPNDNNPTHEYCDFVANWATQALGQTVTASTLLKDIWVAS